MPLCFLDFVKVFDRVQLDELFEIISHTGHDVNDGRLIKNSYLQQKKLFENNKLGDPVRIACGFQHGMHSFANYNLYAEQAFE